MFCPLTAGLYQAMEKTGCVLLEIVSSEVCHGTKSDVRVYQCGLRSITLNNLVSNLGELSIRWFDLHTRFL